MGTGNRPIKKKLRPLLVQPGLYRPRSRWTIKQPNGQRSQQRKPRSRMRFKKAQVSGNNQAQ